MTEPMNTGKSIAEAIKFVSRLGAECEYLASALKEALSCMLLEPALAKAYEAGGKWSVRRQTDEHGWVYTGLAISLPMIARPKRTIGSYLFVQISLMGEGIEVENNHEPLIHIGKWSWPIDFQETQMVFPIHHYDEYSFLLEDECLFHWRCPGYDSEWCYSVRLMDINSPSDIQRHIVNPLRSLLLDTSATQAFADTAAVRYVLSEKESGRYLVSLKS